MRNLSVLHRAILVLVIEGDPYQSAMIERRLRLASFEVDTCRTVDEALQSIEQREYAVVIVDLNIRGKSALDLVRVLSKWGAKTRVILHSLEASFEYAKDAINLGVFAYVEKGANADLVVDECHRAASEFFRLNLEAANDEIAFQLRLLDAVDHGIIATDLQGKIIYWNRFASRLSGVISGAAVGNAITDFVSLQPFDMQLLMSQLESGASWKADCYLGEKSNRSVAIPIRVVATGLKDNLDVLSGTVFSFHDLTLTLAKENSLSLLAKLHLANAEMARSAVDISDRDAFLVEALSKIDKGLDLSRGRVVLWNPILQRNDCIAEKVTNASSTPRTVEMIELAHLELLSTMNGVRIPLIENGKRIGEIEGEFAAQQVFTPEKRDFLQSVESLAACVLLRSWAVSEKLRSEKLFSEQQDQLAHVQRTGTLGHMAAALAHEINQPLGSISNFAGGLLCGIEKKCLVENELSGTLELIRDEAIRAGAIVGRLRKYISLDRFKVEKVNFNTCVQDALQILKYFLANTNVQVELDFDPGVPQVQADVIRCQQVLVNVIKNSAEALCALPESERCIQVQTKNSNGWVHVAISDNGPQVPDSTFATLFQPYSTSKPNGLGMGLCISRSIIEQHHGNMIMSRNTPNGMITMIRIPIS